MTQPTAAWEKLYGKQRAFVYGHDGGVDWNALNVDSDGRLSSKGQAWRSSTLSFINLQVDDGGSLRVAVDDVTFRYKISDIDDPYYGHLAADGAWYIMKLDTGTGEVRYVKGAGGYAAAWSGRAGLTYDLFSETF